MAPSYTSKSKLSIDEIRALSKPTDEVAEFLSAHPIPYPDLSKIAASRTGPAIKAVISSLGSPPPSVQEYEIQIPVPDGWTSRAIVSRPSNSAASEPGPLIVLFHGGGFVTGQPEGVVAFARGFAQLFNAVVVSPSYRLAPEHKFPVGVNDAYDIMAWCGKNASSLGADPSKGFIVGGNSAGANFTPVLARRSIEEGFEPKLTGQWLSYPLLAHLDAAKEGVEGLAKEAHKYKDMWGLSWGQNPDAVLIDSKAIATLLEYYKPDLASPLYNPLVSEPPFDLGRLPKAFVQVAGLDIIRDDGIVYAYALEDAGVDVRLSAYPGTPHAFPAFFPSLEVSKEAKVDIAMCFGWLLGVEVDDEKAKTAMLGRA